MSRFVQGADRQQQTLLPECLDDYVAEDNALRVIDVLRRQTAEHPFGTIKAWMGASEIGEMP